VTLAAIMLASLSEARKHDLAALSQRPQPLDADDERNQSASLPPASIASG
jgi:hypothetical protein